MKLKSVPKNTIVHTPTEEEANELLAILQENGYSVTTNVKEIKRVNRNKDEDICFNVEDEYWGHCTRDWYEKKGYTILTLAEFKERYGEVNLVELLKGHEGEEFFLTTMGTVIFHGVSEQSIQFKSNKTAKDTYLLSSTGKMRENGVILAYPSRALYEQYPLDPYTAWMKWEEEQHKCKMYLMIDNECNENIYEDSFIFRTPADRDKCIEEIKAIIEKYSKK